MITPKPKYSLLEIEKRWIVDKERLPDLSGLVKIEVIDKYFRATRTRLRKFFYTQTKETEYKITKKYGKISPVSEPITTLYLTEEEYNLFNSLKGNILEKQIYRYPFNRNMFLIEIFVKPEVDFILLEAEASSEEHLNELAVPEFVISEVTGERNYEGYSIASQAMT